MHNCTCLKSSATLRCNTELDIGNDFIEYFKSRIYRQSTAYTVQCASNAKDIMSMSLNVLLTSILLATIFKDTGATKEDFYQCVPGIGYNPGGELKQIYNSVF